MSNLTFLSKRAEPVIGRGPLALAEAPLFPVVAVYIIGILTGNHLAPITAPAGWVIPAALLLPAAAALLWRNPTAAKSTFSTALILLFFFALGTWRTVDTHPLSDTGHFSYATGDEGAAYLRGVVREARPGERSLRVRLEVNGARTDSTNFVPATGKLLVYLPVVRQATDIENGDTLAVYGNLYSIGGPLNPGAYDQRKVEGRKGIFHRMQVYDVTDFRVRPPARSSLRRRAESIRKAWFKLLSRTLSGDELAVANALVLGDRELLTTEVRSAYAETGAVHVLAVSGLHVGIVYLIISWVLGRGLRLDRTGWGKVVVTVVSALAIWAFAFVTGLSPSVQRAAIMFTIVAVGRYVKGGKTLLNTLSLAGLLMLVYDPYQLFQLSFTLSFAALLGILSFTSRLYRLVRVGNRFVDGVTGSAAASIGAQLGTLPISLSVFGQFPSYFLVSGTVVILSAFAALALGILTGAAGWISPSFSDPFAFLLSGVVFMQNAFIHLFSELPGHLLRLPDFPPAAAILLALSILLLAAYLRWRKWFFFIVAGILLLGSFGWARSRVQAWDEGAVVVYAIRNATQIDVLPGPGSQGYTIGDLLTVSQTDFSAQPLRERHAYEPGDVLAFTSDLENETLSLNYPLWRLGTTTWWVMEDKQRSPPTDPDVNYLLVRGHLEPKDTPGVANFRGTIVIDGTVPAYLYDDWLAFATENDLDVHVVMTDGALVVPLPR